MWGFFSSVLKTSVKCPARHFSVQSKGECLWRKGPMSISQGPSVSLPCTGSRVQMVPDVVRWVLLGADFHKGKEEVSLCPWVAQGVSSHLEKSAWSWATGRWVRYNMQTECGIWIRLRFVGGRLFSHVFPFPCRTYFPYFLFKNRGKLSHIEYIVR